MSKKFNSLGKFNFDKFETVSDEELVAVTGGDWRKLAGQLQSIFQSIWPNNTAPIYSGIVQHLHIHMERVERLTIATSNVSSN